MRVVDTAVFEALEAAGMWALGLHEDDDLVPPAGAIRVYDAVADADNEGKVVTYPLPYAVYYSNVGDDHSPRLDGRNSRRSVFFPIIYVGEDRSQAKWAGEQIRAALTGSRLSVPDHRVWLVDVQESQRVRRDDDTTQPDGSPLFYGVDNYAVSITFNPR